MPQTDQRDGFTQRTRRLLGERVAYRCSNPDCRRTTIGPHSNAEKSLHVGRAAHICAASPGGPRYDSQHTSEQRAAPSNGIWLCSLCADVIDKDEARYSTSTLYAWKHGAETEVLRHLELGIRPSDVGAAHAQQRDRAEATSLLSRAFDLMAGKTNATRLTWRDQSHATLDEAQRLIADAILLDAENPRLPFVRTEYLLGRGFPEQALTELSRLPAAAAANPTIEHRMLRAECLYYSGEKQHAKQLLTDLVTEPSAPASAHYNLGCIHVEAGEDELAVQHLRRAVKIDRRYIDAWELLGSIAYRRGDLVEAAGCASRAYSLDPTVPNSACNYATTLLDAGRLDDALVMMRDAYGLCPNDARVASVLARALAMSGDAKEAEVMLRRSINLNPRDAISVKNLGSLLVGQNRIPEAIDAFERAILLGHSDADQLQRAVAIAHEHLSKLGDSA